jgi:hypothetical protein
MNGNYDVFSLTQVFDGLIDVGHASTCVRIFVVCDVVNLIFVEELLRKDPWRFWDDLVNPATMTDGFAAAFYEHTISGLLNLLTAQRESLRPCSCVAPLARQSCTRQ